MAIRQRLHLELEDGTVIEPTYDGRDLRAWESHTGRPVLREPVSLSMLAFLGWNAAKREGAINGAYADFQAFDAVCVDVRAADDEQEEAVPEDPTPPAGSATPTADSGG